jgi:hypothetical protein
MTHYIVERILTGQVPANVKSAAARGALPIPREDLIELWILLRNDLDDEVRLACKESLAGIRESEWVELLPGHPFDPKVLDFAVRVLGKTPNILHAAVRSRQVPVETLEWLASRTDPVTVDFMLDNQVRLIESPGVVIALLENPGLTLSQVRRIFDLAEQFFRDHPAIPVLLESRFGLKLGGAGGTFTSAAPAPAPPAPEEEAAEADDLLASLGPMEPMAEGEAEDQALLDDIPMEALAEEAMTAEEFKSLYQRILRMSVPAKLELAMRGNKESRTLLIRDSNKIVQMAVVNSPKISEAEVEAVAKMRNITEDVLRKVARNQEWMKKYPIVKGLATNPKTPIGIAMPLVKRLVDFDLKMLLKDKGVSEVLRREARKIYDDRHTRKVVSFKKK